ncbi:4181_t:CDS:2, partial [Ambispora gerdemannii]
LDKPKANQIRVPLSSTDCRRGHMVDLRRARWGLKAEDPLPDGFLIAVQSRLIKNAMLRLQETDNVLMYSHAQILLNEEPVVEYRPSFMEGLELDAFFRSNRIALEVQGAQHRLHNTSWYKDVKKLEDIVNRDRKKRILCQLNGIYLLEVWYDENPEVTIPKKIYKFRELIDRKIFNLD